MARSNKEGLFDKWWNYNRLKDRIEAVKEVKNIFGRDGQLRMALLETTHNQGTDRRYTLLRGKAAAVLIILIDQESGQKYGLFVQQDRVSIGQKDFSEIVAGMVEEDEDSKITAIRETFEEANLKVLSYNVIELAHVFPSPGILYEEIFLFYTELFMSKSEILELDDTWNGLAEENERTRVRVVPLHELERYISADAKSYLAYCRYMLIP